MNIHEYQAKSILKQFGVAVPEGIVAENVEEAIEAAKKIREKTGVETSFWKKELSTSSYMSFNNLPNGTYAVVVDISNLDKGKKVDDWNGISIRLPENLAGYKYNNALNFVFDIYPYQPWDIGL